MDYMTGSWQKWGRNPLIDKESERKRNEKIDCYRQ